MVQWMNVMKRVLIVTYAMLILFVLGACGIATPVPTFTATTAPSLTPVTASFTSTTVQPQPTIQFAITANPDQLVRWKEYELALASKILYNHPSEEIICEWEILQESGDELYVWAFCLGLPPAGRSEEYAPGASIPAVIHIGPDGSVQSVEIPDYSSSYADGVRRLFPENVQEKIFNHSVHLTELIAHAKTRRHNPGPPLIVQVATPLP